MALQSRSQLYEGKSILHFAPEKAIAGLVQPKALRYVDADADASRANQILDIENIPLESGIFDLVLCMHVLEHVDDRRALSEIFRVLGPGGVAVLMVPIVEGWDHSYEDPNIVSEADRALHFGQKNHVRIYGRDFRERIMAAGFELEVVTNTGEDCVRHGLTPGESIFFATKPAER